MEINNRYRLLARIVLEAETPLAVGSGEKVITTDAAVAKDVNGMPYIPGTSLAGVIKHALGEDSSLFGSQEQGSEIIFSDAKMIGEDGLAIDGLRNDLTSDFYKAYRNLPVRQHVRINEKGAADKHGKFDEEVVYKGTRFCFEIEILSDNNNKEKLEKVINELSYAEFRVGGGSRKGFGKMSVVSCLTKVVDLMDTDQRKWYLNHSSNLSTDFKQSESDDVVEYAPNAVGKSVPYELSLKPEDFFLFGAGFGDEDSDLKPVREKIVNWDENGIPTISVKEAVLIPASSLKGALLHRVAYHYNKINKYFVGNPEAKAGSDNKAVQELFGYDSSKSENTPRGKRGILLFEDIIKVRQDVKEKIFNHVSIDRFTGGAIDGALFNEKADYGKGVEFKTTIILLEDVSEEVQEAFKAALTDLITGMLPLGGGVTKGYGCFTGKCPQLNKEEQNNE